MNKSSVVFYKEKYWENVHRERIWRKWRKRYKFSFSLQRFIKHKILLLCLKTWNLLFCLLTKTKVFFSSFSITNKKQFDKSIYLCSLKIDSREHCFLHCQNYVTFCSTLMNESNSISSFLVTLKYNSFWR